MINPSRLYDSNSKRMLYPQDMVKMGIFVSPDGRPVQIKGGMMVRLNEVHLMHATGWLDITSRPIWEGDIIFGDVPHSFDGAISFTQEKGVILYDNSVGRFFVKIEEAALTQGDVTVTNMRVVGDIYQNKDLLTV